MIMSLESTAESELSRHCGIFKLLSWCSLGGGAAGGGPPLTVRIIATRRASGTVTVHGVSIPELKISTNSL